MHGVIFDPDYWLDLAAKTRATAHVAAGPVAKRLLLDTAAGYEKLAEKARHRRPSDWLYGAD
jgi:hypothetical protein